MGFDAPAEAECPVVACGATMIEQVRISTAPVQSFDVVFSAPMELEAMIGDGTILDAISLQSYRHGSVDLSTGVFTYDAPSQTLTWTTSQSLGPAFYELVVDGGQLRDQSGVAIAGGSAGLAFQIPVYDTQTLLSVARQSARSRQLLGAIVCRLEQ